MAWRRKNNLSGIIFISALSLFLLPVTVPFVRVYAGDFDAERITISELVAKSSRDFLDPNGICNSCGYAGSRFILTANITNTSSSEPQRFAIIMEIRDKEEITQYLQFQTGSLGPTASSNIGISWKPEELGQYKLRSFVISDFDSPKVLSRSYSTSIDVQG